MIHYIPDTNEKYSITKKGIITMHYNGENINSKCNKKVSFQIKGNNKVLKIVNSDKIRTSTTVDALIFRTFNYKTCNDCGSKIYGKKGAYSCVECNKRKDREFGIKDRTNLAKSYCAAKMSLKKDELNDELYLIYKIQLETKRLIKAKSNESKILQCVK